jgi:hypothetical protein
VPDLGDEGGLVCYYKLIVLCTVISLLLLHNLHFSA